MYRRVSFPTPALGCVCPNQEISSQSLIRIFANPLPSVPSHSHPLVVSRGPKLQDRFCRVYLPPAIESVSPPLQRVRMCTRALSKPQRAT